MNPSVVAKFLGVIILAVGAAMAACLPWAALDHETQSLRAFGIAIGVALAGGTGALALGHAPDQQLLRKESLAVVTLGWVTAAFVGAIPYVLSGAIPSWTDAFFESMSGFTTTGSTIVQDIEALPRAVLFWRDLTHWLGGMGIVVLFIAVLPTLGVGGRHLFRSEIPGAVKDGIQPRIKSTASVLWKIYLTLTIVEVVALMGLGMPLFDALCHTFGTLATGGFSTKQASIGHYDSVAIEAVIILFMLLAGVNFSLYFNVLRRTPGRLWADPEFRAYLGIAAAATLCITAELVWRGLGGVAQVGRAAVFQVVSIQTTTGYGTADFELWPPFSKLILCVLMFVGGSSGSTGGGMKVMRVIVLAKYARDQVHKIFEPHAVTSVKWGGAPLPGEIVRDILAFCILFVALFVAGSLCLAALGLDLVSATTAVAATLCNIGPGLELVGPTNDFSAIPTVGKWLLSACMLLGRLEVFTVIALFLPGYWRR